jgi:hypothetical protein
MQLAAKPKQPKFGLLLNHLADSTAKGRIHMQLQPLNAQDQ